MPVDLMEFEYSPSKKTTSKIVVNQVSQEVFHKQLRDAARTLDIQIGNETLPDLLDLLKRNSSPNDPTRLGYGADRAFKWSVLEKEKNIPLPEDIFEQYELLSCRCFMGVFPEICRAWITIDHRLFIWNYDSLNDFFLYENQEQVIISVGLVRAVPGIFLSHIEYVLVFATPVEISVLALEFIDPPHHHQPTNGDTPYAAKELNIHDFEMTCASDNVSMISIVGTDIGRVFMSGNNGHLYEIFYKTEPGMFSRKVTKVDHSASSFSFILPLIFSSSVDLISSIAVDNFRNIIYLLTEKNIIEVIYLERNKKGFRKIGRFNCNADEVSKALEIYSSFNGYLDSRNFKVVSIHPVLSNESSRIHLVAVTNTGCRVYFSCYNTYQSYGYVSTAPSPELCVPNELRLVFARPPPTSWELTNQNQIYAGGVNTNLIPNPIQLAHYSAGTLLLANHLNEDVDSIVGASVDVGAVCQANVWCEMPFSVNTDGKTWDIKELPTQSNTDLATLPCGLGLNDFCTQLSMTSRKFLVLSNSGVTILSKKRPIDLFIRVIVQSNNQITGAVRDCFDSFGISQSCAMCLAIACAHPYTVATSRASNSIRNDFLSGNPQSLMAAASKYYFELGGAPAIKEKPRFYDSNIMGDPSGLLGTPVSAPDIQFSGKHNGLALYISRLVRPIWKVLVVKKSVKLESNVSTQTLVSVQRNVGALDEFLMGSGDFTHAPKPSDVSMNATVNRADEEARNAEKQSIHNLHLLVKQTLETISLILLLNDNNFMIESLSNQEQNELKETTYEHLISSVNGRAIGKILINALVRKLISNQTSVDDVSETLRMRCPSFCSPDDVLLFRGNENLQKAKNTSPPEREYLLRESLRLFISVTSHLLFDKFQEIVGAYKDLRFHDGAIQLGLAYAAAQNGTAATDGPSSEPYMNRIRVYEVIIECLSSIDHCAVVMSVNELNHFRKYVYGVALSSNDETFHYFLYDWLIDQGLTDFLLEVKSKFLEKFLLDGREQLVKCNLLWQLYNKNGNLDKAAEVLSDLADTNEFKINLTTRREYLARASACLKGFSGAKKGGLLNDIEERIEVAQLQQEVLNAAESRPDAEEYLNGLNTHLLTVSELYNSFANPLRMHEILLLIYHTASFDDKIMIESTWVALINDVLETLGNNDVSVTLSNKVREIGGRVFPDDNTFPIRFLCNKLESTSLQFRDGSKTGWVISTMRNVGVPFSSLFQVYNEMFETKLPPWQNAKNLSYLMLQIYFLINGWFNTIEENPLERSNFPVRLVDESIGKYLVSAVPDSETLMSRFQQLQGKLRKRFSR